MINHDSFHGIHYSSPGSTGYGSIPMKIPFLGGWIGWTSIYQLFWCEQKGYRVLDPLPTDLFSHGIFHGRMMGNWWSTMIVSMGFTIGQGPRSMRDTPMQLTSFYEKMMGTWWYTMGKYGDLGVTYFQTTTRNVLDRVLDWIGFVRTS